MKLLQGYHADYSKAKFYAYKNRGLWFFPNHGIEYAFNNILSALPHRFKEIDHETMSNI